MDLLKLLERHPKDFQALKDAQLNIRTRRAKNKTWAASTFVAGVDGHGDAIWSFVHGYESPVRAVLHAIRAGVEARMKAAALFNQESTNAAQ